MFKSTMIRKNFIATTLATAMTVGATTSPTYNKELVRPVVVASNGPIHLKLLGHSSTTTTTTTTSTTVTRSTTTTTTSTSTTSTSTSTTTTTTMFTDVTIDIDDNVVEDVIDVVDTVDIVDDAEVVDVVEDDTSEDIVVEPVEEYVVYKPNTHYIHNSSCRWCDDTCITIDSTDGIEARSCSDCNPDMEIVTPYEEPTPSYTGTAIAVTDYEYIILCNLVAGEYGSDWVSTYDKGAVVATVIHRMWEGTRWTDGASSSIYNVIAAPYQYDGKYLSGSYTSSVTQSCKDAVTYALNNIDAYEYYTNPDGTTVYMINSFYGSGGYNWFSCK